MDLFGLFVMSETGTGTEIDPCPLLKHSHSPGTGTAIGTPVVMYCPCTCSWLKMDLAFIRYKSRCPCTRLGPSNVKISRNIKEPSSIQGPVLVLPSVNGSLPGFYLGYDCKNSMELDQQK